MVGSAPARAHGDTQGFPLRPQRLAREMFFEMPCDDPKGVQAPSRPFRILFLGSQHLSLIRCPAFKLAFTMIRVMFELAVGLASRLAARVLNRLYVGRNVLGFSRMVSFFSRHTQPTCMPTTKRDALSYLANEPSGALLIALDETK